MKTALQELIEYFEQQLRLQRESSIKYTGEEAFLDALEICKNACRTKEKQQIIDAYWAGINGSINDYSESYTVGNEIHNIKAGGGAERYYVETYENKAVV